MKRQLGTFYVDGMLWGVDLIEIQEILRSQPMTTVPLAHPIIRGLMNLRGHVVTAIDLRRRLGRPDRASDQPSMNVVVRTPEGVISLLVDDVGEVAEVDDTELKPIPLTLDVAMRALVRDVYALQDRLLLVLDIPAVQVCEVTR